VVGILFAASRQQPVIAAVLIGVVSLDALVLVFNHGRRPLTDVAARYTSERKDNLDIFLPLWLSRYNKHLFGVLYVMGILWTVAVWLGAA
jgi:hypothetical protein